MRPLRQYDESAFWRRLDELSKSDNVDRNAVDHLKSSVRKVADRAKWISTQVCRYMPQYTLHEERHFLNVLAIMEVLGDPNDRRTRLLRAHHFLPILVFWRD